MTIDTSAEAVAKVLDGVTDGPWEVWHGQIDDSEEDDPENFGVITESGDFITYAFDTDLGASGGNHKSNARFIAAARQLVPALSADLEAMRARAEQAEARVAELEGLAGAMFAAKDACDNLPTDRGGSNGPKGAAINRLIMTMFALRAALSREGGE